MFKFVILDCYSIKLPIELRKVGIKNVQGIFKLEMQQLTLAFITLINNSFKSPKLKCSRNTAPDKH